MRKKTATFGFLLYFFLALTGFAFLFFNIQLQPVSNEEEKVPFVIQRGENLLTVGSHLKEKRLVRSKVAFILWEFFSGYYKKIQAGNYLLSASFSTQEIGKIITKGTDDQKITVIEGLRSEEIGQLLIESGFNLNWEKWLEKTRALKLEGKLFPDTYFIPKKSGIEKILEIFQSNFQKKVVEGLKGEWKKSELDQEKVLILASLVEREAKTKKDKALIAGILLKRLKNQWPLQVDATVQYAVASKLCAKSFNCQWWPSFLSNKDLQISSPYNTYLHPGLPPAPICNPGLDSIKSVLNPEESDFWFYLSGKDGVIHYAKTNKEHEQNKIKYLK